MAIRIYVYTFDFMKNEARVVKTFKIKESVYKKAMKAAKKNKAFLATEIEKWVDAYANGSEIRIESDKK